MSLEVRVSGPAADAARRHVPDLVGDRFASQLFAQDATLWGRDAEDEAGKRLSWVQLATASRSLVPEIESLREELRAAGVDHVVLCGMGGSSLAPEVICATDGVELTVLDSSHPDQVRSALTDRLERSVVVVSSKSGSTVETDSQRRAFVAAFEAAGIAPTERVVIVTDPGSPLDESSRAAGFRVINADPDVGGRYSALTAFGLVPSGLAGADIGRLLDEAASATDVLSADDESNPGLVLGAAIGGTDPLRDKLALVDDGSPLVGFGDWAEQLIAESTGKLGTGILPVVVADTSDPEVQWPAGDVTVARIVGDGWAGEDVEGESRVTVSGPLGAQMLLWEVATAAAGRILGINPFDQPDVESAKVAAREMLEGTPDDTEPAFVDQDVEVRVLGGRGDWLGDAATLEEAVAGLFTQLDPHHGYVAVMAYLDRLAHPELADVRRSIALRTERPTTFGWGPRFLHSTGQLHKGGPETGVYLQITGTPEGDVAIPDRPFGFATLVSAQAAGDAQVLADHGRPVLRLHLRDQKAGLDAVRRVLGGA